MVNISSIHDVIFEERDTQIFNIPDIKTKLSTLQHYFFPRMESLLRFSLEQVSRVYGVNPYDRMTFVYRPNHRTKAKDNINCDIVHVGVGAKRGRSPLKIFRENGKPFFFHPTYLTFKVLPTGVMYVELLPFRQSVDDDYVMRISTLVQQHQDILMPLLAFVHVSHRSEVSYCDFIPLCQAIVPEEIGTLGIKLVSPKYYFPIDSRRGLIELVLAFILLYAVAESFICIGEGSEPPLLQRLEQFKDWYKTIEGTTQVNVEIENEEESLGADNFEVEIPDLDSYSFIRPGKWWTVLARDQWRCLSCGRTARVDGVLLEVDHIVPRSKGGSDDIENLQTLCKKCNIGKSNKDSARL